MFGIFQHCILPGEEKRKANVLEPVKENAAEERTNNSVYYSTGNKARSVIEDILSGESDDQVFQDEQDESSDDENVVNWLSTEKATASTKRLATINHKDEVSSKSKRKSRSSKKESFKVVETDKNRVLVSSTQVMVFRKPTKPNEEPTLLHIHKRALETSNRKKRRRKCRNTGSSSSSDASSSVPQGTKEVLSWLPTQGQPIITEEADGDYCSI